MNDLILQGYFRDFVLTALHAKRELKFEHTKPTSHLSRKPITKTESAKSRLIYYPMGDSLQ